MAATEAAFYLYPEPGSGSPVTLSLGECITGYDERPDVEVADAVSLAGGRQRAVGRWGKRVRLTLEDMLQDGQLGWKLLALQNHLDRGYSVGFTADTTRAWAAFLPTPYSAGTTSLTPGVPPFSSMVGAGQQVFADDWIRLTSQPPENTEEAVQVDTWTSSSSISLHASAAPLFTPTQSVFASWVMFWPLLKRPAEDVGKNITLIKAGGLWSMQVELVTDPVALWGFNLYDGDVLNGAELGGRTLDSHQRTLRGDFDADDVAVVFSDPTEPLLLG